MQHSCLGSVLSADKQSCCIVQCAVSGSKRHFEYGNEKRRGVGTGGE